MTSRPALLYSSAVSRLRRPFLSDRFWIVTVRLLKRRLYAAILCSFVAR
jgi:hypothetical protein